MKALVEAALVGTARQPDRARSALAGDSPPDALVAVIPSERSTPTVIPRERRTPTVIPS